MHVWLENKQKYTLVEHFLEGMMVGERILKHIRGTECDLHVQSDGHSSTKIRSPMTYQPGVECTIVLDGMQSRRKLEHVTVTFQSFNIPSRLK